MPPEDFAKAREWASTPEASPEFVRNVILALQDAQSAGEANAASARRAVEALARAMGIIPSSEKVTKSSVESVPLDDELSALEIEKNKLEKLSRYIGRRLSTTRRRIAELMRRARSAESVDVAVDGDGDESRSRESVLAGSAVVRQDEACETQAATEQNSSMGKGTIKTQTKQRRKDFVMYRKDWNILGTKSYNPTSGKTLTPDMSEVGPHGWSVTWRAMVNVVTLVFGMALPAARIEKLFGKDGFSRSNISDMCAYIAMRLVPVYIALTEQIAQADIIMGDDCVSRVSEVTRYLRALQQWKKDRNEAADPEVYEKERPEPEAPWAKRSEKISDQTKLQDSEEIVSPKELQSSEQPVSLVGRLESELDFTFQNARKDKSKTPKIRLHTSLLSAETRTGDPKSRVVLYRTHLGSVGNLLSRVLLSRKKNLGPLVFVGDLSSSNRVTDTDVLAHVNISYAGCASHARRPFKRHLDQDPLNCTDALDAFRALFHVEEIIDESLKSQRGEIRRETSLSFWNDLKEICEDMQGRWSPATVLGEGAQYVLGNFDALTRYCHDPRLPLSNDLSERLLRYEKLMDRSSFGRETVEGRARYDIIRSFWQSSVAAGVDPTVALLDILVSNPETVEASPSNFTPQAIASRLRTDSTQRARLNKILYAASPGELVTYKLHDPNVPNPERPA